MSEILFEKVSYETFINSFKVNSRCFNSLIKDTLLQKLYDDIKLPVRSTAGSAGYDFFMPFDLSLSPGLSVVIPTGIKCKLPVDKVLMIYPRSGLGFKNRLMLSNTVGVIDSDYYDNNDNEGHIMIKIYNAGHARNDVEWKLNLSTQGNSHHLIYNQSYTTNEAEPKTIWLDQGKAFAQGVITKYYTTDDDESTGTREGGLGSTDKEK